MKLFTYDPAPNPMRVGLFIKAKGLSLETVQIDLMKGAQFDDSYQKINPRCTVPALQLDDGEVISEVIAICNYLDEVYPEHRMMGDSAEDRARVIGWMHRLFLEGLMPVADVLRNGNKNFSGRALPGPVDVEQIPALVERGNTMIGVFYETLNAALEGRQWLATDKLSQADIDAFCIIGFTGWVQREVPESCANIGAWQARFKQALEM